MTIATSLALILAGAALPAADKVAVDAAIARIYGPYGQNKEQQLLWERPIYSAEIRALIAHWQRVVPKDEVDALNDGDWLCQCQDADYRAFRAVPLGMRRLADGRAEVRLRVELGFGARRPTRLLMKREGGGWLLDDLYGPDFPKGLKQKLRETIKEDEAL